MCDTYANGVTVVICGIEFYTIRSGTTGAVALSMKSEDGEIWAIFLGRV